MPLLGYEVQSRTQRGTGLHARGCGGLQVAAPLTSRSVLPRYFFQYGRMERCPPISQTFSLKPCEWTLFMLKPCMGTQTPASPKGRVRPAALPLPWPPAAPTWVGVMVLTSSDARRFSSVVFPALSSPSRTMRSSCSEEPFSLWMTESSPWGHGVLGEPCRVPGHCRAPSFRRGELGALLAMGTLCLWAELAPELGSQGVQAQGGPTADLPSPNSPRKVCCPCPGSPTSSWVCWGDKPRV